MGRPPASAHAIATPERVLEAAERSFAAVGYGTATLADIADRAGIRRPSLLYHFGTKEALYAQTVERCFGRLHRTVVRYVKFLDAEPQLARIVLRELLEEQGPGRAIVLRQVVPLLDVIERFVRQQGEHEVRPDVPVRAAVLQVGASALMRAAAGSLREPLWGAEDHSTQLARLLLLREPTASAEP
jgi:AcrR family transcriptional regulator